ncbi:MAG: type II secretion system F family protein [Thermoguttaceae bacterium]|jgi:type II secretory pathway component PulF|nr:type II secretion system F family protein [Thermoguttaceae bacterium]
MTDGNRPLEESVELGGQLAAVAAANLPLGPGLRALAAEVSRRSLRNALVRAADRLDAGDPLDRVLSAEHGFPGYVRGLVLAGLRSGRLGQALAEFAAIERDRLELHRQIRAALRYPVVLVGFGLALVLMFSVFVVPGFAKVFADFGLDLPLATEVFLWTVKYGVWHFVALVVVLGLVLVEVCKTGRPAWLQRWSYHVPVLGPLWRCQGLAEFARLMGLLVDQQLPLAESFEWAADSLRQRDLAEASRRAATRAREGLPAAEAMGQSGGFPPTLRTAVASVQAAAGLGDAFRAAGEVYDRRARVYVRVLRAVAAPMAFLFVAGFIGSMFVALAIPMLSLFHRLT